MKPNTLSHLKSRLRPGRVYRREDLLPWSKSVDRSLSALTSDGTLRKIRTGLYYCPKRFEFGEVPADEHELVRAFLSSDRFIITSPNSFNQLGLGTTQLYNKRVVYNQKRHGVFNLDGRTFVFERRANIPKHLTIEFLLVDLVNELDSLAEDQASLLLRVKAKAAELNSNKLAKAILLFGSCATQKKFREMLCRG